MSEIPRVLLTAESTAYGGVERRLLDEIRVLRGLGFAVDLAPRRFDGSEPWLAEARDAGATVLRWPVYKFIERGHWIFPLPQSAWVSRWTLPRRRYAFAHVAMPWTTAGLSRMVALKRASVPVVLGLHLEYGTPRIHPSLRSLANEGLAAVVAGYGVSGVVLESFRRAYPDLKIAQNFQIIWNGINEEKFRPNPNARKSLRERWSWCNSERVLMVCGRLDPVKNIGMLIDAFGLALQRQTSLRLLVVGDGPQRKQLERQAESLGSRVRFVGHVDDVASHLAAADVYVSASSREGFPLAASEALSMNLPLVMADMPVNREAFGACAAVRLVDGESAASWADTLAQAVQSSDPAGNSARSFVIERLTSRVMHERLADFYKDIKIG